MEECKDIKGYEGLYQVSNEGRVRSLKRDKILANLNINGYMGINLHKNGIMKQYKIHRLVAEAFIPNPDNLPQVNHKNELKDDNNVENLEWCDCKYNSNYGTRNQRLSDIKKKIVYQYSGDTLVTIYSSLSEVESKGFNIGHISECCSMKRKKHKGYRWSYKLL